MKIKYITLSILAFSLLSCKEDEHGPHDENELITTVKLNFSANGQTQTFAYRDIDGDGGMAAVVDKISLSPTTNYDVTVSFSDESKNPAVNITEEVEEEADEHLVIFTSNPSGLGIYSYADKDSKNLPIGLKGQFRTTTAGTGKLKVQLRHQPPVGGKDTKNGTATPGSDDVNIEFNLEVK